jgi:hypothetical protein
VQSSNIHYTAIVGNSSLLVAETIIIETPQR